MPTGWATPSPTTRSRIDLLRSPAASVFPYAPGGNAVYRRDALLSVGGFDEEYQYYLEETDLCVRLIDRGWLVRQVDGGAIHHKFLPSGIRTSTKVLRDRFAVIKNKVYFSLVNGLEDHSITEVLADDAEFCQHHRNDANWHLEQGNMTAEEAEHSLASMDRGVDRRPCRRACGGGWRSGSAPTTPRTSSDRTSWCSRCAHCPSPAAPLLRHPDAAADGHRRDRALRAGPVPGAGRRVATRSTSSPAPRTTPRWTSSTGVWVHRIRKDAAAGAEAADLPILRGADLVVPDRLADNTLAVLAEVRRIAGQRTARRRLRGDVGRRAARGAAPHRRPRRHGAGHDVRDHPAHTCRSGRRTPSS